MKNYVAYPSFRLLRSFGENNCVTASIKLILASDESPLFLIFLTRQGFISYQNHSEVSVAWLVACET